uniref:spindle and kinetochore-associated protein 3 isoform X2 n=1 Tax=Solea senegalensis TaxID=28829 RepID=UPI001CD88711|nr:spindle and kinetochore-associated protein 3 isoform X2 [Solea senegalensis]
MDPTTLFFSTLKKLAVTLESETAKLQHSFENRNDEEDSEAAAKGMRAYHELNCEVVNLKGQIQDRLTQQKAQESEVSSFIKACRVMEQRVGEDIRTLRGHWQKYGYQAPMDAPQRPSNKVLESEAEDENETKSTQEEEEGGDDEYQEESGEDHAPSSPSSAPPTSTDVLRTPQLCDFGLSEMQLKRVLAGAEWCSEVPPMPEMRLPHPSLSTPVPPPLPLTPKCVLRMDDDELQTPQMHDFGISEHTMCLNNDFTMALLQKNIEKPQRLQDKRVPPMGSPKEGLQTKAEDLESPLTPVFCTPGFKIKKTKGLCAPESPCHPGLLPSTPEVPAFKTPYVIRLVSNKKPERINIQTDDDGDSRSCKPPSPWEYNVPEISIMALEDKQMPEMPNLESLLGNSLQNRSAKIQKKTSVRETVSKEMCDNSLESDGSSQEFSLGTPRIRINYQEPTTPEMPDLSSVTQDICKLMSQAQLKRSEVAVVQPRLRPGKENRGVSLSVISESEFQSLPGYLRQMSLHNLNQAVHNINQFTAQFPGEKTELQMDELRRITNVGAVTPIYILCLTELKRLQHVGGVRDTAVYKLSAHN